MDEKELTIIYDKLSKRISDRTNTEMAKVNSYREGYVDALGDFEAMITERLEEKKGGE